MNSKIPFWPLFATTSLVYLIAMFCDLPFYVQAPLKVLPIFLLMALLLHRPHAPAYLWPALAFSACGDVLLALPIANGFVLGLGAFLIAQLSYAIGFYTQRRQPITVKAKTRLAFIIVTSLGLAAVILPKTGDLLIAVSVYLSAIVIMACMAACHRTERAILFSGVLLFVLSDSLIAVNKFIIPFETSGWAIMITYYAAQALIVTGVLSDGEKVRAGDLASS